MFTSGRLHENMHIGGFRDHADFKSNGSHISKTWFLIKKATPILRTCECTNFSNVTATDVLRYSKHSEWLFLGESFKILSSSSITLLK